MGLPAPSSAADTGLGQLRFLGRFFKDQHASLLAGMGSMKALRKTAGRFITAQDGLVTTEWVAITAGLIIAAVAIGFIVSKNTYKAGSKLGSTNTTTVNAL